MSEPVSRSLREQLPSVSTIVTSAQEFLEAPRDLKTVSFVDDSTLAELAKLAVEMGVPLEQMAPPGPVVAICNDTLPSAIGWLTTHPWLSHVVSAALLRQPIAVEHLRNVMQTLTKGGQPRLLDWLGPTIVGRRIKLTQASKRVERLARMNEFFEARGINSRTVQQLGEVAEELLTNAFYSAPSAVGAPKQPIARTEDVTLPNVSPCDLGYGCREDLAIVRVRDPFGSLSRARLIEVLTKCARSDLQVPVDERVGRTGLGLWRVFSTASFVAVSVNNNRTTEVLVGIGNGAVARPHPFAFHLFFKEQGRPVRRWKLLDADSTQNGVVDHSIAIVNK